MLSWYVAGVTDATVSDQVPKTQLTHDELFKAATGVVDLISPLGDVEQTNRNALAPCLCG